MLRVAVILSLAVVAMAFTVPHEKDYTESIVRFGTVGTTFADLVGVLTPVTPVLAKGIPSYLFSRIVDGVPVVEDVKYNFRCSVISDFYVPHVKDAKPVLLCRNEAFEKSVDTSADRIAFLFSAENLNLHGVHDIELSVGKKLWDDFVVTHATAFATPVLKADAVTVRKIESVKPRDTMLTYNVEKVQGERRKRQFGGGFSGSGAQAGASSFGGGGGFGGFPGGGFGGGFSGSQASAGAGSFGGGGGFFG